MHPEEAEHPLQAISFIYRPYYLHMLSPNTLAGLNFKAAFRKLHWYCLLLQGLFSLHMFTARMTFFM